MSLPANYTTGQSFTAAEEDAVETAVNADTNELSGASSGVILLNPTITGYTETIQSVGTVTTTKTLPAVSNGTVLTATLTASTACVFTMPAVVAGKSTSFVLLLKQAATTGGGTATFTGVKWPSSGTPVQTSTAATMDSYTFISDGTEWYGSYNQGYTP
jgi:hypothetical protein